MKIPWTLIILGGGGAYLYYQLNQAYQAALADRNALISQLTPAQQQTLNTATAQVGTIASQLAASATSAIKTVTSSL